MKKVFITSITGAQGRHIADVFQQHGYRVASITREDTHINGIDSVVGEFSETDKLAAAMSGSVAVVLTLPLLFDSETITTMTQQIIDAAKVANVGKIVFNSSIPLGEQKTGYAAIDVKHDAVAVLEQSGLDVVTLMPTIYLDNLASPFLLPVIKENKIVPYPIADDVRFNWTSYENLGRYSVAAVEDNSVIGQRILISNQDNQSKQQIADLIGQAIGEPLHYIATTPEQFEENLQPVLGDYVAKEISNLYRGVAKHHADFSRYSNLDFINSVELQSTADWVKSVNWG